MHVHFTILHLDAWPQREAGVKLVLIIKKRPIFVMLMMLLSCLLAGIYIKKY